MKAKILAATPKPYGDGKTLYEVVTDTGKLYTCFSNRIKDKVGQEVEFEEEVKEYRGEKQYNMKLAAEGNKPPFSGGGRSFGKSAEEIEVTKRTMLMAYTKDIVVASLQTNSDYHIANATKDISAIFGIMLQLVDTYSNKPIPKDESIKEPF